MLQVKSFKTKNLIINFYIDYRNVFLVIGYHLLICYIKVQRLFLVFGLVKLKVLITKSKFAV